MNDDFNYTAMMGLNIPPAGHPHGPKPMTKEEIRNEVIEEMCTWLEACLAQVDHNSETFLSCTAMVRGLRNKKTAVPDQPEKLEGQHYPLTNHGIPKR